MIFSHLLVGKSQCFSLSLSPQNLTILWSVYTKSEYIINQQQQASNGYGMVAQAVLQVWLGFAIGGQGIGVQLLVHGLIQRENHLFSVLNFK